MSSRASPSAITPEATQPPAPALHASSPAPNGAQFPPDLRPLSLDVLPPELLSVIDASFIRTAPKHALLKRLQSVPASNAVQYFLDGRKTRRLASAMINTSKPVRALRVLIIAHRLDCVLKKSIYEGVAKDMAVARRWHLISPLVALCSRQLGRLSVRLLDWRIRALMETAKYSALDHVVEQFNREGLSPGRRTYQILLTGHIRNHDLPKALDMLSRMQQAGFPVDASTQAAIVAAYRALGSDEMVRTHAFDALHTANTRTATLILNALAQLAIDTHDSEQLAFVLQLFDQSKFPVGRFLFPAGSSIAGGGASAYQDAASPSPPPISPDVATYTILLNHMAYLGDRRTAMAIYHQMLAVGITPDARVVAALVRVHLSASDPAAALSATINMCDLLDPQSLIHDLGLTITPSTPSRQRRIKPTAEIFNTLAQGILLTHGLDSMRAILKSMWNCSVSPDSETVRIFLAYLGRRERAHPRRVLKTLKVLLSSTGRPSVKHVSIIFHAILRHERPRLLSGWFTTPGDHLSFAARNAGVYRSLDKYMGTPRGSRSSAYEHQGKQSLEPLVRPILQSLADRAVQPDRAVTASAIKYNAVTKMDMRAARDVFQGMLEKGMYPEEHHYSALLEGYAIEGDFAAAEAVMDAARLAGVHPGAVMYTILICGYGRAGKADRAMRVLQEMVNAGVKPDVPAVDAIVGAYFAMGAHMFARRLLLDLWPSVAPFPEDLRTTPLKTLIEAFRSLHRGERTRARMSKKQRTWLNAKLKHVVRAWNASGQSGGERNGAVEQGRDKTSIMVPRNSE
ncbi:hypothetical protein EVG20_g1948 [Dentipellis fragilis]|uniref:Pentacotripeptide-repeat region of PRORP domain-containing protein n=1 Tax=Dentipellis fragilis TaxID=205917 RepID=A0A4Y9ZB73_9AGAM|nr:hypothetical protein EVG20_g1948 [Dentipellis fragilis]